MFWIAATVVLVALCSLLPFLPGRYDPLAAPLFLMAQIVGSVGLVLVPLGALWLAAERSPRLAGKRRPLALAALVAASLVWAFVALAAAAQSGFALGAICLAVWASTATSLRRASLPRALPLALVVVPLAVAVLQFALLGRAVEWSRDRAIRNAAPLIGDIERYKATHGRYPVSLLAEWPDYLPGVIGIPQYHYEPSGDAYNLFFEQFSDRFGTREFVMYNPRDEHAMTSHAAYRLQLAPDRQASARGYYAVHDARHAHWKYFWFD